MSDGRNHPDDELIYSITSDVMKCLANSKFFEELDDRLSPAGSAERQFCAGDHQIAESILRSHGFDDASVTEVLQVLAGQGGFCDCEVLYNVADTSRLKAEYWQAKARGGAVRLSHESSK